MSILKLAVMNSIIRSSKSIQGRDEIVDRCRKLKEFKGTLAPQQAIRLIIEEMESDGLITKRSGVQYYRIHLELLTRARDKLLHDTGGTVEVKHLERELLKYLSKSMVDTVLRNLSK
jgi:hypothetical protein